MVFWGEYRRLDPNRRMAAWCVKVASGPRYAMAERFLQRQRAGHDFAVNRVQRLVGHRAFIGLSDAVENGPLAVRRIDFFAGLPFDFADREDMFGAFVEQPDDVSVQTRSMALRCSGMFTVKGEWRVKNAAPGYRPFSAAGSGCPSSAGFPGSASAFCVATSEFNCSCSGGAVARPGSRVTSAGRSLEDDFSQLIRRREPFQAAQPEVFQEQGGRAVVHRASDHFGASNLLDEAALEEGLHDAVHVHAADLFDFGAGDRLPIGDDGEGLEGGLRETRRARFDANQRAEPGGVFRLGDELPGSGYADQAIAALGQFVILGELFQRVGHIALPGLLEGLDRGV